MRLSSALLLAALLSACAPDSSPPAASGANASSAAATGDQGRLTQVAGAPAAGDTLPASGRSLFDFLVTDRNGDTAVQSVPFPFTALVTRIEAALGDSDGRMLERVLIPVGRSLQRNAANPHFFNYPRVVLAVVGDGAVRAGASGMLLKDRLYIGYQERAAAMEIISYNEAAGRFEFQVVSDYREGGAAQVHYVDRTNCVPCHQNQAPIFSRPPWDETNANAAVAARLRAVQDRFYGVPVNAGIDAPNAIDDATDRANLLFAYQRIWMEACGTDTEDALRCRGNALASALRFRLSGLRHPAEGADIAETALIATLRQHWPQVWPQGLAVPNADIPNRELALRAQNPDLLDLPAALRADRPLTTAETVAVARVPRELEPFEPRSPRVTWRSEAVDQALVDAFVSGLASFLAKADVQRLDEHLLATRARAAGDRSFTLPCALAPAAPDDGLDLAVTCGGGGGDAVVEKTAASARLEAHITIERADELVRGTVARLELPGLETLHDLDIARSSVRREAGVWRAQLDLREATAGLHVRLTNGNALQPIDLEWQEHGGSLQGEAVIGVSDDFAPLAAAIDDMVATGVAGGSDALSERPFRRVAVLTELFEKLAMQPITWCCLEPQGLPPAQLGEIVVPPVAPGEP